MYRAERPDRVGNDHEAGRPDTSDYDTAATALTWQRTLDFLDRL